MALACDDTNLRKIYLTEAEQIIKLDFYWRFQNTKISPYTLRVSSLVKKTNYDTKITEIEKKLTDHNHDKYITTPEFNKLSAEVFDARLARANLVTKTDFDDKIKSQNEKNNSNKTKH